MSRIRNAVVAHRVVCFDRRGHSSSAGPDTRHGPRTQHENDLAGLIEAVGDTVRAILAEAAAVNASPVAVVASSN